jgi:hypothetical protein
MSLCIEGNDLEKRRSKRTNVLEPDRQSSTMIDFDERNEDDHAVMVHTERPNEAEPNSDETIGGSLPQLATKSSDATDDHEHLSLDSAVQISVNRSVDTEEFEEAYEAEIDDITKWWDGFGFQRFGRLAQDTPKRTPVKNEKRQRNWRSSMTEAIIMARCFWRGRSLPQSLFIWTWMTERLGQIWSLQISSKNSTQSYVQVGNTFFDFEDQPQSNLCG